MVDRSYLRDKAAVVGIGQTEFSKYSGRSELQVAVEAIKSVLDNYGLTPSDVDGSVKLSGDIPGATDIMNALGIQNIRSMAHWKMVGVIPQCTGEVKHTDSSERHNHDVGSPIVVNFELFNKSSQ